MILIQEEIFLEIDENVKECHKVLKKIFQYVIVKLSFVNIMEIMEYVNEMDQRLASHYKYWINRKKKQLRKQEIKQ